MLSKAKTFFHYTGSFDKLTSILRSGFFWPRFCLEDYSWLEDGTPSWAFPMCSFCDIPFSRIESHTALYGEYGIGLRQDWGVKNGLNPVMYINPTSTLAKDLRAVLYKGKLVDEMGRLVDEFAFDAALSVFSHIKPISGLSYRTTPPTQTEFHLECEWRWVPCDLRRGCFYEGKFLVAPDEFRDASFIENAHAETYKFGLPFSLFDLTYLIVRDTDEVARLVEFLEQNFGSVLTPQQLKVLFTRITCLQILTDL